LFFIKKTTKIIVSVVIKMVKGNAETRINDSESFFCNILIRVKIENGGRKAKVKYIDTSSISNGKFGELEKLGNYQ